MRCSRGLVRVSACCSRDGRALTAGELVQAAGVSPQTTSGHLGKLTDGRLIVCVKQGRHRYYRIATPRVAEMLESIMAVIADAQPRRMPGHDETVGGIDGAG